MRIVILLTFSLLALSFNINCEDKKQITTDNNKVVINVHLKNATRISVTSGFNAALLPYHLETKYDSLLPLLKDLSPKLLRFPGGIIANYYHPEGAGYGINPELATSERIRNKYSMVFNQHNQVERENITDNYKVSFAKLCKELNSEVLIVANLLDGTINETINLIKYFNGKNINIAGVELGNEYYLHGYIPEFPSVDGYIEICRNFVQVIKAQFPNLKIGVVVAPSNEEFDNISIRRRFRFKTWNEKLSKENFYDGIIAHTYTKANACIEIASVEERYSCALEKANDFTDNRLQRIVQDYQKVFGDSTKIWITEWNMKSKAKEMPFGDTFLQACNALDYMFNTIRLNKTLGKPIEYSTYHNLCAGGEAYPLVRPTPRRKKTRQPDFVKHSAYFSFLMLKEVFTKEMSYISIEKDELTKDIDLGVFYDKNEKKLICYVTNKSAKKIDDFQLNFENFNAETLSITRLKADSLNAKHESLVYNHKDFVDNKTNILPALSISKFIFKVKEI